jgi:hypothetical protein
MTMALLILLATGAPSAGGTQIQDAPLLPKHSWSWSIGRKLTAGMIAGLNSELLFTNQRPADALLTSLLFYTPSFILVDEAVQRWNLDALSTWLLGSLYGIRLEGLLLGTVHEDPMVDLPYTVLFWHGWLTTATTFEITENLFPRDAFRPHARFWWTTGMLSTLLLTAAFLPVSLPLHLEDPVGTAAFLGTGGIVSLALFRRVHGSSSYHPYPLLAASLLALGYTLGGYHQAQRSSTSRDLPAFTPMDHLIRTAYVVGLETLLLLRAMRHGAP